ncbi:hypothetical protein CR513_21301, partial [Mucuna pruriens]
MLLLQEFDLEIKDKKVTKSFAAAFRIPRSNRSFIFVIRHLEAATTDQVGRPESTRLWVLLAHNFPRRSPIYLNLRIVSASRNGHQPKA